MCPCSDEILIVHVLICCHFIIKLKTKVASYTYPKSIGHYEAPRESWLALYATLKVVLWISYIARLLSFCTLANSYSLLYIYIYR